MAENESEDPFERILNASNRDHLDNPFRTSSDLRARHFPGAGPKLSHPKLVQAYLAEAETPNPDWQLLAHGTWPWVIGHGHDLIGLKPDLERLIAQGEQPVDAARHKTYVAKYSESGTEEIEIFLRIFAQGGKDFQKAVIEKLSEQAPGDAPKPQRTPRSPSSRSRIKTEPGKPTVEDLDPITRAKMAMIGTLFFLILSLIPVGIQFWRQPEADHWIVLGITGILGLLSIVLVIDYLRKKP